MSLKNGFIIIFSLLCVIIIKGEIREEQNVLVLNDDNFDDALRLHKDILVNFYAPWCHVCIELAPGYEKAAQTLNYDWPDVKIAKVDATDNPKLSDRFQINGGYPKLKMFKNGSPVSYKGGRTAKSIVLWLKKNTWPAVTRVNNVDEARKLQQSNDVLILGFFKGSSYASSSFTYAADGINDIFAATYEPSVFREYGMNESVDGILILKTFDEQKNIYNGTFDYRDIQTWVNANRYPMVTEYTPESGNGFLLVSDIKPRNLLFIGRNYYDYNKIYNNYREASQEFRGRVLFEIVDTDRPDLAPSIMEQYNARKNDPPKIKVFVDGKGATQYASSFSDFTKENIVQFTKDYLSQLGM